MSRGRSMARKNTRRRRKAPRWQMPRLDWGRVAGTVSAVAVVVATYLAAMWLMDRPIQQVVVTGAFERVSADRVEATMAHMLDKGFLGADLEAVRRELEQMDWIAGATVRRRWPSSLVVRVTEQEAAACWGERGLLNRQGELFVKQTDHVPMELPRLAGPPGTEARVTERYFALQEELERRGLAAMSLTLGERGDWKLRLSNGIRVRFGAKDVDQRIQRFLYALDRVVAVVAKEVDYVDMRYTNGFAIGWKQKPMRNAAAGESGPNV